MKATTAPAPTARSSDPGQRGAAMLVVATILIALLAGGGVALYVQLQNTKSAGMVQASRASLYCAEAGLAASRGIIAMNYLSWSLLLDNDPANDPPWYPLVGDIDNPPDGVNDYMVTIRDNDDEVPPTAQDAARDNDRQVFAVARCTKNAELAREVVELLIVGGAGQTYRGQAGGGAFNAGNQNAGQSP